MNLFELNKTNKTIALLLILLLITKTSALSQEQNDIDLLNAGKERVNEINNLVLCKQTLTYDGLYDNNGKISVTNYREVEESVSFIYYDEAKRIRKFVYLYNYPEELGYSIHYFDKAGDAVHSVYHTQSALSTGVVGYKYCCGEKPVYVNVLLNDSEIGVKREIAQYGAEMIVTNNRAFDDFLHTDSILVFCKYIYQLETINYPTDCVKVVFGMPSINEKAIVNARNVNIRKEPSFEGRVIAVVELGTVLQVASGRKDMEDSDWYKIYCDEFTGYIYKEYLELVESDL